MSDFFLDISDSMARIKRLGSGVSAGPCIQITKLGQKWWCSGVAACSGWFFRCRYTLSLLFSNTYSPCSGVAAFLHTRTREGTSREHFRKSENSGIDNGAYLFAHARARAKKPLHRYTWRNTMISLMKACSGRCFSSRYTPLHRYTCDRLFTTTE